MKGLGFFIPKPTRRRSGFTTVEMVVALGVFAVATLGIWETIRTVFFLSAKNTGVNLSHAAQQLGVDRLAEKLRGALQIVDVANFDGSTFTHIDETSVSGTSAAGNAVRFLRLLPVTLYLLPDDGSGYSETNPENPASLLYPDYLTPGNKSVKATYTLTNTTLTDQSLVADLKGARLFPRFPYLTETISTGPDQGTIPGLTLSSSPSFSGANSAALLLTYGLPTGTSFPSCNQAYLVIVSAAAILNRGSAYAEMVYYPDATNLSRTSSLTSSLAPSSSGNGPAAFALPKTAGALSDPTARGSLQITLPVLAPYLNNSVFRRGGTAALVNVEMTLPVETRRRAQF